jgi:hypothetical protein
MVVCSAQVTSRSEDFPSFYDVVFAHLTATVVRNASSFSCFFSFTK